MNQSSGAVGHTWPQFLPDGRRFIFYQRGATPEAQGVYVGSLDSPAIAPVLRTVSMGLYSSAHLLFARDSMLFAQAFDLRTLTISGEPVRVADRVGYFTASLGYMAASASSTGTLAIGPGVAPTTELRWFDRAGVPFGVAGGPAVNTSPRLSPDQRSVAVSIYDPNAAQRDVWVLDLARGAASRATFDIDGVVTDTGPGGSTRPCVQLDAHWRTSCVSHRS